MASADHRRRDVAVDHVVVERGSPRVVVLLPQGVQQFLDDLRRRGAGGSPCSGSAMAASVGAFAVTG